MKYQLRIKRQTRALMTWLMTILAPLFWGGVGGGLASCDSDSLEGDSYYTFTGETVASYVENRPDSFSVFSQIVKDAGEEALLSTYGHYTAFIPTDEAFSDFFREHSTSLEQLSADEKRNIVYNHIIRSTAIDYLTKDFTEGALGTSNMNNRYIIISYVRNDHGRNSILIN